MSGANRMIPSIPMQAIVMSLSIADTVTQIINSTDILESL